MKQKKSKTITIGSSEQNLHLNDIGSPNLHKNHKVCVRSIDDTKLGRAIVLDQHIIDVMFHEDYLSAKQHNVCNKYLGIISRSGCFASAPGLEKILFAGESNFTKPVPKACVLLGVQRLIKEVCGGEKEKIFWKIMSENPKKVNSVQIHVTLECADALLDFWYVNQESPVSLFQQALTSP